VATRKALALLEAGAVVRVVSPMLSETLAALADAGRVDAEQRVYRPGDLTDAFLAVAATDDRAVNAAVADEARAARVLVTVCDDPAAGDVAGLATIQRGDLTIGISTNGRSPALARLLREELEAFLSPARLHLLELMAEARQAARAAGRRIPPERWQAAATAALALLETGEVEAARQRFQALIHGDVPETPSALAPAGATQE
jgi:precorrin-2 dehydrogenase/sirohydrochlorin ferrochelatase